MLLSSIGNLLKRLFSDNQENKIDTNSLESLAQARIYVRFGSLKDIKKAILDYSDLSSHLSSIKIPVKVSKLSKYSMIEFPKGVVPYDLINLLGWLNGPPDDVKVSKSMGWIISPKTNIRYHFIQEEENKFSDTLIGHSSNDESISAYLPDGSLCETSNEKPNIKFPADVNAAESITLSMIANVNESFGNPDFVINTDKDFNWHAT